MKIKIYQMIKENDGATLSYIAERLGISKVEASKIIREEIRRGFLVERDGKYHVRVFLMPPVQKPAEGIAWSADAIHKEMPLPSKYMNPHINKVAARQQGDRGTCVGQASSAMMDFIHIMLTGEEPTGTIVRNIAEGNSLRDILFDQSFSAECIYQYSRQEGRITSPSGSYCSAAIRALKKRGVCLESQWWTSKTSRAVWATPHPAVSSIIDGEIVQHVLSGYAVINSLSALKQTLCMYGVSIGAINIYANFMSGGLITENGVSVYDGNLPDPNGDVAGSHALCFIGYDDETRKLYFRHSWEGWTKMGSISYDYWEKAGGDFWTPLDEHETIIGLKIYRTITINVNPAEAAACAVLTINGVQRSEKVPANIALEKGKTAIISVAAPGFMAQTKELPSVSDSDSSVTFTLETDTVKTVPLWDRLVGFFRNLINAILRR